MATRHRFLVNGKERTVVLSEEGGQTVVRIDDGDPIALDATTSGVPGLFSIVAAGRPRRAFVAREGVGFDIAVDGRRFHVAPAGQGAQGRRAVGGAGDPLGQISAPLAGVVVSIRVAVGDRIEAGQVLLILEAMKMQNEVSSPHPGVVTAIRCEAGGRVDAGALLLSYEPDEAAG